MLYRIEVLCTRGRSKCCAQAVTGRRVADAGAGIDIVVAEGRANEFLHQESFLVRAARGGNAANRAASVCRLDTLEFRGDATNRFLPRDLAPRLGNRFADHRLEDAFAVISVTPGEAAFDARVAAVRLAVLIRHHANHLVAAAFRLE